MVRKKREREMEIGQFVVYMKCHNMGSTRGWESAGVKRKGKGIRGLEQSGELALEKGQKCQEQQQKQRPIHPSALWNASRAGRRNVICGQSKFKAKSVVLALTQSPETFLSLSFFHTLFHTHVQHYTFLTMQDQSQEPSIPQKPKLKWLPLEGNPDVSPC